MQWLVWMSYLMPAKEVTKEMMLKKLMNRLNDLKALVLVNLKRTRALGPSWYP